VTLEFESTQPAKYLNFYVHCQNEWTDSWDCMCNDECPVCHTKDIEPYQSLEITHEGAAGNMVRHVPEIWVPDGGWPSDKLTP
jgi:hypothetical protein